MKLSYPINTERLALTPYTMDYLESFFQLKQLPETHRYNYSSAMSKDEALKYVTDFCNYDYDHPKGRLELAIVLKEGDAYIGYIGFKGDRFEPDSTAEIYYTIHPEYFSKGFGTEAVVGMIGFGFDVLRLHRIWAGATCENLGSWRIMEKVGMRRESHWLKDRPKPGRWRPGEGFEKTDEWEDGYGYAILRNESQSNRAV